MPTAVLDEPRLHALAGRPLTDRALDDLLFASKAEVEGRDGSQLTVSVTPDRLDLLTEGGLGLYLQGVLDVARGIPKYHSSLPPDSRRMFLADASVVPIRPFIAGAVLHAPPEGAVDLALLAEAVRFQELLHATIGRNRRAASLGLYPVERLEFPVRYALEPIDSVRFVPLDAEEEVEGGTFFEQHPMAQTYGPLGRSERSCLTLRDARSAVLSVPPVLNSRATGEVRAGDREILVEATGTRERSVQEAVGLMLLPFVAQGWAVSPIPVDHGPTGRDDGRGVVSSRSVELPAMTLRQLSGAPLSASAVEQRLSACRLGSHPHSGGWRVEVPPWRPDLTTAVDVVEDVLLAAGVSPESGILPPSSTRGSLRHETVFRRRLASALLGLGLAAPHTSLLVPDSTVARVAGASPIRLRYPVSAEFAFVRDRLLLSHLDVLGRNTRHGYPQRIGEVAPVVGRAPGSETGTETRYHAGLLLASDATGFAEVASLVDYLLRTVDVVGTREPADLPGMIPGRAARVRIAGETVAELGEIAPGLLSDLGVPVPAAWAELDLSALWPLVARPNQLEASSGN